MYIYLNISIQGNLNVSISICMFTENDPKRNQNFCNLFIYFFNKNSFKVCVWLNALNSHLPQKLALFIIFYIFILFQVQKFLKFQAFQTNLLLIIKCPREIAVVTFFGADSDSIRDIMIRCVSRFIDVKIVGPCKLSRVNFLAFSCVWHKRKQANSQGRRSFNVFALFHQRWCHCVVYIRANIYNDPFGGQIRYGLPFAGNESSFLGERKIGSLRNESHRGARIVHHRRHPPPRPAYPPRDARVLLFTSRFP